MDSLRGAAARGRHDVDAAVRPLAAGPRRDRAVAARHRARVPGLAAGAACAANGSPAFGQYRPSRRTAATTPWSLQVIEVSDGRIVGINFPRHGPAVPAVRPAPEPPRRAHSGGPLDDVERVNPSPHGPVQSTSAFFGSRCSSVSTGRRGRHGRRRGRARRRPRTAARPRRRRTLRPRPTSPAWTPSARAGRAASTGAIVVLWKAFWLQSTKIFPGRSALAIVGRHPVRRLPLEHRPDGPGEVGGVLVGDAGVFSGTYNCRPFEPDVLHQPSQLDRGEDLADPQGDLAAVADVGAGPGVEVEDDRPRRVLSVGRQAIGAWSSRAARLAAHTSAAGLLDDGSSRCRRGDRPGRAPRAPSRGGASGSASRRSRSRRCRRGTAST